MSKPQFYGLVWRDAQKIVTRKSVQRKKYLPVKDFKSKGVLLPPQDNEYINQSVIIHGLSLNQWPKQPPNE